MTYPTQRGTLTRLEAETRRASRAHEDQCVASIKYGWQNTKRAMRGSIMAEYPGLKWNLRTAGPALERMGRATWGHLTIFHKVAVQLTRQSVLDAYKHEAQRQAWMLDVLTPPSYQAKLPRKALRESVADYTVGWEDALAEWLRAYGTNLGTNLRLEALHEGGVSDAGAEVDAAKIDGFDPEYKLSSMMTNQILGAQRDARADVGEDNGELVAEEIFQTMEDADVCPDCGSQDGVPVDQVNVFGHVYSFNCRCFERIVPRQWAQLLRGGDEFEREAALMMDDAGIIPDSMAVRGPDGGLVGTFVTPFSQWSVTQGLRNLTGVAP